MGEMSPPPSIHIVLEELHRARQELLEHLDAQDAKVGVLFAIAGAAVPLAASLPALSAALTALGAAVALFTSARAYRTTVTMLKPDVMYAKRDMDPGRLTWELAVTARKNVEELRGKTKFKADMIWYTRLWLGVAFTSGTMGVIWHAWRSTLGKG